MALAWVIGLGKSGYSAACLLKQNDWQVYISDRSTNAELSLKQELLEAKGIQVFLGFDLLATEIKLNPDLPDLLVVSPGIPWQHPTLIQARDLGIKVIGEVELAWQFLQHIPWVSVTGTNGKTTTTALIAQIFQTAGFSAPACGNIGIPICEVALQDPPPDWVIAELSSYQIESSPSVRSQIGVWTTFTPDHLSRHENLEAYSEIKASLMRRSHHVVLNGNDQYLAKEGNTKVEGYINTSIIWTGIKAPIIDVELPDARMAKAYIESGWVKFDGISICALNTWQLVGEHNQQNLLMAVATARLANIEPSIIAAAVAEFRGVPHRLEVIGTWQGVTFVNDSKATNYDAAWMGLKSGEAAPQFAKFLTEIGYHHYETVNTLQAAIPRAMALAVDMTTVLFSPACASFDQYVNFEQRGDHFRDLCTQLLAHNVLD
jgi:UDP-N-acetylmuramoylalanine--D-glutamate ligase